MPKVSEQINDPGGRRRPQRVQAFLRDPSQAHTVSLGASQGRPTDLGASIRRVRGRLREGDGGAYSRGKRSFRDLSLNSPSLRLLTNLKKAARREICTPEAQLLLTLYTCGGRRRGRTCLPQPLEALRAVLSSCQRCRA